MKRTEKHHTTLSRTVVQFIKHKGLMKSGQHVIVAVSGGIDSMVLLDLLAKQKDVLKVRLTVAHVNFGLRGRSSVADENFVKRSAAEYRIPCFTTRVDCKGFAAARKISIQEAARELRYEFFDNLKKSLSAEVVATAHNANDNAETMLFHFFRGSGLQGLLGIPVRRSFFVRPLLFAARTEIEQYAGEHGVAYREDASNRKEHYTRNYIRKTIVPRIEERINPSLTQTMQKESEIFSALSSFVAEETQRCRQRVAGALSISLREFRQCHPFLQHAVVKTMLEELNVEPAFSLIDQIVALQDHQKGSAAEINAHYRCERTNDRLIIVPKEEEKGFHYLLPSPATIRNERFTFSVTPATKENKRTGDPSTEYIDAESVSFPLTVRSWRAGDAFVPLGMKGRKKLSDFFGEKKFSTEQKSEVPIVLSGDAIVWVGGLRLDDRCKITEQTRSTYKLTLTYHGKKNGHRQ